MTQHVEPMDIIETEIENQQVIFAPAQSSQGVRTRAYGIESDVKGTKGYLHQRRNVRIVVHQENRRIMPDMNLCQWYKRGFTGRERRSVVGVFRREARHTLDIDLLSMNFNNCLA